MVYVWYIPDIYMVYTIHIPELVLCKFCQVTKKQCMQDEMEMHVLSMTFQDNNVFPSKNHVSLQDRIYHVYTGISLVYTMQNSCASLLGCPSAFGSLRPGLPSDLLSFGHR